MSKQDLKNTKLRKEICLRFKKFRESIKKSQAELANELNVCRNTMTRIETGKAVPGIPIQNYLNRQYQLNINWLLTGKGKMIIPPKDASKTGDSPILFSYIDENDPRFEKYVELIGLMHNPDIEQIIFGKLERLKVIDKEEINEWLTNNPGESKHET
jgi:DNA-binding XRE family transcriptional regulator